MSIQIGKSVALTAVGGMVAGLAACGGAPAVPEAPSVDAPSADTDMPAADDAAMPEEGDAAKDCCKGHNECKGMGNCKVEGSHDCKGNNECKGNGGCKPADCA